MYIFEANLENISFLRQEFKGQWKTYSQGQLEQLQRQGARDDDGGDIGKMDGVLVVPLVPRWRKWVVNGNHRK